MHFYFKMRIGLYFFLERSVETIWKSQTVLLNLVYPTVGVDDEEYKSSSFNFTNKVSYMAANKYLT